MESARQQHKPKRKAEKDPVMRELKKARRGDVVKIRAHLLNEENQEKVRRFAEEQDEVRVMEVQGSIGMGGWQRLSPVVCANVGTLRRVSLRANELRVPAVLDLVCALQLPSNETLELLDLSSNPIGNEGFKVLMSNVLHNRALQALLLSKCSITDDGVEQSQSYIQNKALPTSSRFYLNLSHNQIGPKGHTTIAASLPPWMSLSLTRQRPPVLLPSSPEKHPIIPAEDIKPIPLLTNGCSHTKAEKEEEEEEEEVEETDEDDAPIARRPKTLIPTRGICRLVPVVTASGKTRMTVYHANPKRRLYLAEV
eukprot:TRINITY_DN8633_c3_g1_i1.p1 TRINITY_DN8633_c3_g1~~TRINITY_DN8633_c3_g1_i1.p1  ORF type:complete len:347 (+),score=114.88 TRINITY_DN8633_c3_g1_i1:113-1042(+)